MFDVQQRRIGTVEKKKQVWIANKTEIKTIESLHLLVFIAPAYACLPTIFPSSVLWNIVRCFYITTEDR